MERTTDLEKLKQGEPFTWGKLVRIHNIGDYDIVEYHPGKRNGIRITVEDPDLNISEFSCYYLGQSLSRGADSLDSALARCIAYKYDGINSQASLFFMRMIGATK